MSWMWSTEDLEEFKYSKVKISHCKKCGIRRLRTFSYQFDTTVSKEVIDNESLILVHDSYYGILDKKANFKRISLPRYATGYREKVDVSNEPNVPCVIYPRMWDVSRNIFIVNESLLKTPERYVLSGDVIVGREDLLREEEIEIYQTVCFKCLQMIFDEKVIRQGNLLIKIVKEEEEKEEEKIFRNKVQHSYQHRFYSVYDSSSISIYNHTIEIRMEESYSSCYTLEIEGIGIFGVIDFYGKASVISRSPDHEDLEIEVDKHDSVLIFHPRPTPELD